MNSKQSNQPDLLEGDYTVLKVEDKSGEEVFLPSKFTMRVMKIDDKQYRIALKIGNTLGCMLKLSASTTESGERIPTTAGPVMSTMMLPPEDIFHVEQCLSKILPSMNEVSFAGSNLTFYCTEGKILFEKC